MGRIKALFAVVVVAVLIFLAIKLLPPYVNNYELQDSIDSIARMATYAQNKSDEDIRNDVLQKGKEIGIPLTADNVTIKKDQVECDIDVKYTIAVPVPGYTFRLNFNPTAGNRQITAK